MDSSIPVQRYQPGGDIYSELATQYGKAGADQVAAAALEGGAALTKAIADVRTNARITVGEQNDSTLSNFFDRITTDPLAAPLESANNQLGKAALNVFKNPWVLLAVALLIFYWLGGFMLLKGILGRRP